MAKDEDKDKDTSKDDASDEGKLKQTGELGSTEFVQIPKSEYEGWKKKVDDLDKFRSDNEEYLKGASIVVNTLATDPNLTDAFRQAYAKQQGMDVQGEGTGQQQEQKPTEDKTNANDGSKAQSYNKDLEEVKSSQREEIVSAFEKDYGIANLPEEERKEARRKVEGFLNEFGWSVKSMPLTNLRSSMERAFVGTHAEKLKEEGKLEGFVQAKANQAGVMGSFPSANLEKSQETDLTPAQKEWNKKLGVEDEKAKKTIQAKDTEETRLSGAEVRAQKKAE